MMEESLFLRLDGKIWRLLGEAEQKGLKPVRLRLSPAAGILFRQSREGQMQCQYAEDGIPTWRGMDVVVEGSLSEVTERRKEIRICVEAHADGQFGRHYYFDADCSDLPEFEW